jgi:O-antigen ligase
MSFEAVFPAVNLLCTAVAAALWYVAPQLGAWPLLLAVLPWLWRLERKGRWDWHSPFDPPLLLFVLTAGVAVWSAYDREAAWAKFWPIVAGVLLFYAFGAFSTREVEMIDGEEAGRGGAETAAWLLAGFGGLVTLYMLLTHDWNEYPASTAALTRLAQGLQGPLPTLPLHRLHPNVIGGILAMLLPFALGVSWSAARQGRWLATAVGLLAAGLMLGGLLLSSSRGAWLALGGALALALLWALLGWMTGESGHRRAWFLGILLLLATAVLGVIVLAPEAPTGLIERLPALAGGDSRLDLARNSLILVEDYPFIGAGLDGFMMLYSTYAYLIHVGFIVHAHNLYLDVAIEQGLLGLLALLWTWLLFGAALWRAAADGRVGWWLGVAALSLTTIALHGLVEDAFYGSRAVMLLFLPLAFALPFPAAESVGLWRPAWLIPAALLGGAAIIFILWGPALRSRWTSNVTAVQQSRTELSRYSWPEWPIQDALRREVDMGPIMDGYERALALDAGNPSALRRLGQIELSLGLYQEALGHLQAGYEERPWDNATRQMLGEALLLNGQTAEGQALLVGVNNAQGQLGARVYWNRSIGAEETAALIEQVNSE